MPYRVIYSAGFERAAAQFGAAVRRRLDDALDLLSKAPFHPRLHTKPLAGPLKGLYAFRLGRDIRVIFIFKENSTIHLLKIAKRDEIYR